MKELEVVYENLNLLLKKILNHWNLLIPICSVNRLKYYTGERAIL